MNALDIIRAKRDGRELTDEQVRWFIERYTDGTVPDEQAAALLMAIVFRGMTPRELATWTAAMIDSRDFIAAKRRAETEVMLPPGPKIALTGGLDFNDHHLIWDRLDKVQAKHPDMVLLHGGSPKGAELIASKWATSRKVPQIAFKPDWTKHAKAAPFKRNDAILELLPIGVMHFPGTGIQDNLADKAKRLGIPVWKFGGA